MNTAAVGQAMQRLSQQLADVSQPAHVRKGIRAVSPLERPHISGAETALHGHQQPTQGAQRAVVATYNAQREEMRQKEQLRRDQQATSRWMYPAQRRKGSQAMGARMGRLARHGKDTDVRRLLRLVSTSDSACANYFAGDACQFSLDAYRASSPVERRQKSPDLSTWISKHSAMADRVQTHHGDISFGSRDINIRVPLSPSTRSRRSPTSRRTSPYVSPSVSRTGSPYSSSGPSGRYIPRSRSVKDTRCHSATQNLPRVITATEITGFATMSVFRCCVQGSPMGGLTTRDPIRVERLDHRRASPVIRSHTQSSYEAAVSRALSASSRDSLSTSSVATPRRVHMSPDAQRRSEETERVTQKAHMPKCRASVASSLNRLRLEQGSVDVTYRSLSSLRQTRKSWELLQERPTPRPQLGSPSARYPSAGLTARSNNKRIGSPKPVEVEHVARWLKDVSTALEREQETIEDARRQQVGSPPPVRRTDACQMTVAKLEESQVELLAVQKRAQVCANAS